MNERLLKKLKKIERGCIRAQVVFLLLFLLGLIAQPVNGANLNIITISNPASPEIIGSYPGTTSYLSYYLAVKIYNNRALVLQEDRLLVLNISSPTSPTVSGALALPGDCRSMVLVGQYLYISSYDLGNIYIVDVSGASVPTSYTTFDAGGYIHNLHACNGYLFAVSNNNGKVFIFNMSNPQVLSKTAEISVAYPKDVFAAGSHAYIISHSGLEIYDTSIPSAPVKKSVYAGDFETVFINGTTALLGDYSGLIILNVSNPAAPTLLKTDAYDGMPSAAIFSGSTGYIANDRRGLRVTDVSDPANPVLLGSRENYGEAAELAVSGNTLYAARYDGLQLFDISNPALPTAAGAVSVDDKFWTVRVKDNYLYAAVTHKNSTYFRIYDISDTAAPVQIAQISSVAYNFTFINIIGNYAYLGSMQTVQVFDVGNPSAPAAVSSLAVKGLNMARYGNYAYLVSDRKVLILNISSPGSPVQAGQLSISGLEDPQAVAVHGNYLYVAGYYGFLVYSLSAPSAPALVKTYSPHSGGIDAYGSGDNLFLLNSAGINAVYLGEPEVPETRGYYDPIYYISKITVSNNRIYAVIPHQDILTALQYTHSETPAKISLDRDQLYFGYQRGSLSITTQTIRVTAAGNTTLSANTVAFQNWISNSQGPIVGGSEVSVSLDVQDADQLAQGSYTGTLTFFNYYNSFDSQTVTIHLQVYAAGRGTSLSPLSGGLQSRLGVYAADQLPTQQRKRHLRPVGGCRGYGRQ